ncbi:hypothetical protein VPH35_026169 [Triticum aestivum]
MTSSPIVLQFRQSSYREFTNAASPLNQNPEKRFSKQDHGGHGGGCDERPPPQAGRRADGRVQAAEEPEGRDHAALERVSSSSAQPVDRQVRIWAGQVRELSYDVEDNIDRFMVRVDLHHPWFSGFIGRCLNLLTTARARHRIAADIRGIKGRVKEVADRRDRYRVDDDVSAVRRPGGTTIDIDPHLHGMYEDSARLVAVGGPRAELCRLLVEQEGAATMDGQLKVVSIVGIGGLGKTTLANVVYQQIRGQFDCDAFVTVSLKPDLRRVLASLLRQVSKQSYSEVEAWDVVELIDKIRKILRDKRYLIIVDDIWDESAWNCIKSVLVENKCSSRVITTTRIAGVAASCSSSINGNIYKLNPLAHDDSRKLFHERIFGSEDACHVELREISEKIMRKCDGVPLAIITIASLLSHKPKNIHEWDTVNKSIGSGLEKFPNMENMRQILSISYYDLPSHLKPCFLYLSVYPEDYTILSDHLVRRWISEGLVHGSDVDTLYKVGFGYFNDLINRSLIQPQHVDSRGNVGACHVHDMVLDLITSLSIEENFVTTLDSHQPSDLSKKIHRLSIQNNQEHHTMSLSMLSLSHVRSFIIFPSATKLMPPLSRFQVLRVLDLEGCRDLVNHHIDGVGNLFHLRYLGLRDTNITKIPKGVGNLYCLQTLDLSQSGIIDLPSTIVQLRKLVCLYIETSAKLPDGIGAMKSLQVLSTVGVSNSPNFSKELGYLSDMRVLKISLSGTWDKNYEKHLLCSLCKLTKIKEISIQSSGVPTKFIVDLGWTPHNLQYFFGNIPRLPEWMNSSLSKLSTLIITLDKIQQEDLGTLGNIPFLNYLCVTVHKIKKAEERLIIGTDHANFKCLSEFHIHNDSLGIMFVEGAMPRLQTLEVTFQVREAKDEYNNFEVGLENLHSIKLVTIRMHCSGSSLVEVEEADAAMRKTSHVNPKHPRVDVITYYEDEMIEDEEKSQLDEEAFKEQEIILEKIGPWGGNTGRKRDIKVAPRYLRSMRICCGDVIDAFAFSYLDRNENLHETPLWGGVGGTIHTILLEPSEFLIEISGTFGPYGQFPSIIKSLMLVTNLRIYGPFGQLHGTPFHSRVKKNGSIVGFFGCSGEFLDAIGVYIHP